MAHNERKSSLRFFISLTTTKHIVEHHWREDRETARLIIDPGHGGREWRGREMRAMIYVMEIPSRGGRRSRSGNLESEENVGYSLQQSHTMNIILCTIVLEPAVCVCDSSI